MYNCLYKEKRAHSCEELPARRSSLSSLHAQSSWVCLVDLAPIGQLSRTRQSSRLYMLCPAFSISLSALSYRGSLLSSPRSICNQSAHSRPRSALSIGLRFAVLGLRSAAIILARWVCSAILGLRSVVF